MSRGVFECLHGIFFFFFYKYFTLPKTTVKLYLQKVGHGIMVLDPTNCQLAQPPRYNIHGASSALSHRSDAVPWCYPRNLSNGLVASIFRSQANMSLKFRSAQCCVTFASAFGVWHCRLAFLWLAQGRTSAHVPTKHQALNLCSLNAGPASQQLENFGTW